MKISVQVLFVFLLPFIANTKTTEREDKNIYKEQIRRTIKDSLSDIRKCYEIFLDAMKNSKTNTDGKVVLSWDIDIHGKAQNIKMKEDPFKNETLKKCMTETLQKVQFLKPPDGQITAVEDFPLLLEKTKK